MGQLQFIVFHLLYSVVAIIKLMPSEQDTNFPRQVQKS